MQRFGDDSCGFSVDFPTVGSAVVRAWGFWTMQVASAFDKSVIEACRGCSRGTVLTLEMSELKPMRDEGQQSFSVLLRALPSLGILKVRIVTTNALTKLQLVRLTSEVDASVGCEWVNGTNTTGRSS